jgi:hypothetical protein
MAISLASAAKIVAKALEEVKVDLNHAYKETLYDVGASLVYYTPILTGLASSNWNVDKTGGISTVRQPSEGIKGTASLEAIETQIESFNLGDTAIFSNPVDYIDDLEKGTSRQAPAGMVTPTRVRIDDIWLENLKKYNLI